LIRVVLGRSGVVVPVLMATLLLVAPVRAQEGKRDTETGKIRLLYIGDATNTRNPVFIYKSDPIFLPTLIPSCRDVLFAAGLKIDDIYRYMRQYMPKTFEQMRDSYDIIILSDVCVLNFRPEQIVWMERCVREDGFGLVMVGGIESFGGSSNYPGWTGTQVADALPVAFGDTGISSPSGPLRLQVALPDNELMRSIPWKSAPSFSGLNIVKLKDGASELARAASMTNQYPLMADWIYEKGRSFAFTPDWTPGWGAEFSLWEYYLDAASNLGIYSSRNPVPQDLQLVHANRAEFYAMLTRKALLGSLFDFVDRFGASTGKLESRVAEVDEMVSSAEASYVRQDYEGSLSVLGDAAKAIGEIEAAALKLKDRAMLWVYVIEWFAILGTSFACGTVLWAVMIRRRLYREVLVTRAR